MIRKRNLLLAEPSLDGLEQFPIPIEELKPLVAQKGDIFKSEELTVKTKFGEYIVTSDIFTAKSYNSFIQKIVSSISEVHVRLSNKNIKSFPIMQINSTLIAKLIDDYIRHRLFTKDFNPMEDNNWRILLFTESRIIQHIVRNVAKSIYDLQNSLRVSEAKIIKKYFKKNIFKS